MWKRIARLNQGAPGNLDEPGMECGKEKKIVDVNANLTLTQIIELNRLTQTVDPPPGLLDMY